MDINTIQTRFQQFIKDNWPDADLAPGSVLNEWLLKISATLHKDIIDSDIEAISAAGSIEEALLSNVDTFSPVIDSIATNYNTIRNAGSKSSGLIKITVNSDQSYYIPSGFKLVQPTLNFEYATTRDYTVISGTTTNPGQLKRYNLGNGLYYFLLPVEALGAGEENNAVKAVQNNTRFTFNSTYNLSGFVDALAYGNFQPGANKESDVDLITRFKDGLATRNLISPISIKNNLMDNFTGFQSLAIVGPNDVEMPRGKHNIFGITTLGKADIYVKSSTTLQTKTITMTGTLVNGSYSIYVSNNEAELISAGYNESQIQDILSIAGFYNVQNIKLTGTDQLGLYNNLLINYSVGNTSSAQTNDVVDIIDARYSAYQRAVLTFQLDDMQNAAATQEFDITFVYMPNIKAIQDHINNPDNRVVCSDYLVRGIIPCVVNINLSLLSNSNNPITSAVVNSIKTDIFNHVNSLTYGVPIYGSSLIDICHSYPQVKKVNLPIKMHGDIWIPKETWSSSVDNIYTVVDSDLLNIPVISLNDITVSSKNCAFFLNIGDNTDLQESINITYA